ncbi:MAG: hypothetical protein JNL67_13395 [Planctomycetaceae bacterium]|nr:hypothetical protein [Planctomycetaceae bacterium]
MMLRRVENFRDKLTGWCWPIVGALILCLLFAPVLSGRNILAFRDAAYWHSNTLQWTATQWQAGKVPLWNDLHGLGVNWVGQGTTAVFYPGTWLLAIPVGEFGQRYAAIIVLHLLLAGWGVFGLARVWNLSPLAAWFGALTFTLSGPVLALHGNWPFLIGATWLPWSLAGLWQAIVQRRRAGVWNAGLALALMVLGGEPQAVVLWMLAAMSLLGIQALNAPTPQHAGLATAAKWSCLWTSSRTVLAIAVLATAASCVQWWPLWETSQASTRAIRDNPTNVYQALELWNSRAPDWAARTQQGLLGQPKRDSPADHALQFSQPPWHWGTLFAGNVMGTWRWVHARWDRHLAANDRVWNPTLYAGATTGALVCSRFGALLLLLIRRVRLGNRGRRLYRRRIGASDPQAAWDSNDSIRRHTLVEIWLWLILVLFGLGSCGWYGPVWLWTEIQAALGFAVETPSVGPHVGSVYWWLTLWCPGFDQFRYPAKLWIYAALAWSLLASFEFERWFVSPHKTSWSSRVAGWPRALRRPMLSVTLLLLLLLSVLGITISRPFVERFSQAFEQVPIDPWLGGLQVSQALLEVHLSLMQACVVCGLLLAGLWWRHRCPSAWWGWCIVAITVADLTIGNAWMVQSIDRRALTDKTPWDRSESPYLDPLSSERSLAQQRFWHEPELLQQHRLRQMSEKWGDYWPWQPVDKWTWQSIYSMRATGAPQFHLTQGIPSVNVEHTLEPAAFTFLRDEVAREVRSLPEEEGQFLWRSYLRGMGVRHGLSWTVDLANPRKPAKLQWITLPETPAAVWLATDWEVRPRNQPATSADDWKADLGSIWLHEHQITDSPERPILDDGPASPSHAAGTMSTATTAPDGSAGIISWQYTEQEKSAVVKSVRPVVVIWRQGHDPGWWAVVVSNGDSPKWQATTAVHRLFTGVVLPPGEHRVLLVYWPRWYWIGGAITLLSWCGLFGVWMLRWISPLRQLRQRERSPS